jgi:iduronate 2-sulfatase
MFSLRTFLAIIGSSLSLLAQTARPNVLFIAVDDLRTELGCYGADHIISPNIDRLAETGTRFERAYCMVPTCGASRASLMSGLRPTPERFVSFTARIDEEAKDIIPLHTHFKNNGYRTISLGKILHFPADSPEGWSEPAWRPDRSFRAESESIIGWPAPPNLNELNAQSRNHRLPFASFDTDDDSLGDGLVAAEAINQLQDLANQDKPFFLAVGFFKPHLPFNAPKKYWDLYKDTPIDLPENYYPPKDAPKEAIHNFGELRSYTGVPKTGPVSDEMARTLIRGYYACVSFADAQIGRVLNELDRLGLSENTIVVLWGDHGWNLGEHTLWCKHCTFENSMHAPLIIRTPKQMANRRGNHTDALAEYIDIYPTLCELTGLEKPDHLEGESLLPILNEPARSGKGFAIGRFRNGDTIRTDQWRYTEYTSAEDHGNGQTIARMLYNHNSDPEENFNLASNPKYKDVLEKLSRNLNRLKGRPSKSQ